jgi:hypothetical protein
LNAHHFAVVQLESLDSIPLGPRARTALLQNYRIVRQDDNGVFLLPQ